MKKIRKTMFGISVCIGVALWLMFFVMEAQPREMFGPIVTEGLIQAEIPILHYHEGKLYTVQFIYRPRLANYTDRDYRLILWCEAKDKNGRVLERLETRKTEDGDIFILPAGKTLPFKAEYFFSENVFSKTVRFDRGVIVIPVDNSI